MVNSQEIHHIIINHRNLPHFDVIPGAEHGRYIRPVSSQYRKEWDENLGTGIDHRISTEGVGVDGMHNKHFSFLTLSIIMAGWSKLVGICARRRKKDTVHLAKVFR